MKKTVYVVEDHPLMRKSMIAALNREADLTVCGEADNVTTALTEILTAHPDLVLTDLELRLSSGLDLIASLRAKIPVLPILATTLFDLGENERKARAAGASGFVPKHDGPERMIAVARALLRDAAAATTCGAA